MTAPFHKTDHYSPAPQYTMPNTYLDKAIEAVPKFEERISLCIWESFPTNLPRQMSMTT